MIALWLLGLACESPARFSAELTLSDGALRAALPTEAELPQGPVDADAGRVWLGVQVAGAETEQGVSGTYARDGDDLVFTPRFAVQPDTTWEVAWHPPGGQGQVFVMPVAASRPPGEPPRLVRLEPGAERVPENLLKLTLTFSKPMRGGLTLTDHIHLTDLDTGERDDRAWYRQELWGPERERLTVLFHPGRVKTGVSFNRDFGPVLRAGGRYRVDVTEGLVDLSDQPLQAPGSWTFTATAADQTRPVPEDWVLTAPGSPSAMLTLTLDEPMDRWLLEHAFAVEDPLGAVPGTWTPADGGAAVTFLPRDPWSPGDYVLRQVGQVEDRAGNTPGRIFDGPPETVERQGPIQDTWHFTVEDP